METAFEPTTVFFGAEPQPSRRQGRAGLAAAVLVGVVAAVLAIFDAAVDVPLEVLVLAGLIAGIVGLAVIRLGLGQTRLGRARAKGWVDVRTGLYNVDGLIGLGQPLLERMRAEGRPLSLAVLDFNDLLEVHSIYGRAVAAELVEKIVSQLRLAAGTTGVLARTGRTQFTLVLPGAARKKAQAVLFRAMGRPCCVELDAGGEEIVLVPDVMVEDADAEVASLAVLFQRLGRNLSQHRESEARWHRYLQRERERHSRPMSLFSMSRPMAEPPTEQEQAALGIA
jgi:GGDEF domain-containing protein